MFKALLSKEWAQLRALRWVAVLLGLLLPVFLVAGAELATQGWLPFGSLSGYTVRTVLMEAMPAALAGLWGLLALLVTAQAFCGDRGAGTEAFLLQRPVRRSTVWRARLSAAVLTLLAGVAFHLLAWILVARVVVAPDPGSWGRAWFVVGSVGALSICLGLLGGTAAAALVASPMHAVLLGLILAALPAGLASFLGGRFSMVAFGDVPLGLVLPAILLVGYVVAAFRADCRGEPAGRGRLLRGIVPLAIFLVSVPVVFAVAAPLALRWNAAHDRLHLHAPERGGMALVLGQSWRRTAGWIVDVERGRKVRFLPPPVLDAAWHPDGSRLAVLHLASPLGSMRGDLKLDVLDANGEPSGPGLELDLTREWVDDLRWSGDLLIGKASQGRRGSSLLIIDPEAGTTRRVELDREGWTWWIVGPTDDGTFYIHRMVSPEEKRYALHRLELERGGLDPEPVLIEEHFPSYGKSLSPSGRYWLRRLPERGFRLTDLESGSEYPLPDCRWADWVDDDRLLGLDAVGERRIAWIAVPGADRERLREWDRAAVAVSLSPDRRRAMVRVWDRADGSGDDARPRHYWSPTGEWVESSRRLSELWTYAPGASGGLVDRSAWLADQPEHAESLEWAGPDRLAATGPGLLALRAVGGDRWSYVIGRP